MAHLYQITVQNQHDSSQQLDFTASLHDDLFEILAKVSTRLALPPAQQQAFVVGLKLLGETLMQQHRDPLLKPLLPHFKALMMELKGKSRLSADTDEQKA